MPEFSDIISKHLVRGVGKAVDDYREGKKKKKKHEKRAYELGQREAYRRYNVLNVHR